MNFRIFFIGLGVLATIIFCLIGWQWYQYYGYVHADDPIKPSLTIITGGAKIIRGDTAIELGSGESYDLMDDDIIETNLSSTAQVIWPDRSVTRLGSLTRIVIHHMLVDPGYARIQVSFSLKKGKIWSNVVRTLIGDSYFETRLPKNGIVAGVRGTVYEINLDKKYIHAVEHAVSLTDTKKQPIILFPGEVVDSENIWLKQGKQIIDTSWSEFNSQKDTLYRELRTRLLTLPNTSGDTWILQSYDRCMRWFFSQFKGYEILQIDSLIHSESISTISGFSIDELTPYYQRFQSISQSGTIDILRQALLEKSKGAPQEMRSLMQGVQLQVLWEGLGSETMTRGARKILEEAKFPQFTGIGENIQRQDIKKTLESLFEGGL